jgi:Uma2 family endonuclease
MIDDLLSMPDDKRYDLINGEIVEVGTSNERHSTLVMWLAWMLMTHVSAIKLRGHVKDPDGTYQLNTTNVKAPDMSYLTSISAVKVPPGIVYCPFAPDFVIEVKVVV